MFFRQKVECWKLSRSSVLWTSFIRIDSHDTPLVLLCPAWKKWGTATTVKANTTILHSRQDDVVPFENSEELVSNSDLPESALVEVGNDHRLADEEPLAREHRYSFQPDSVSLSR
jgi:hypothetical protein